jgi:hypothetical protein
MKQEIGQQHLQTRLVHSVDRPVAVTQRKLPEKLDLEQQISP